MEEATARRRSPLLADRQDPPGENARYRWPNRYSHRAARELLIGYARVSTNEQDLTAQRNGLAALGVPETDLCRPRPDRHQPRPPRPARSPRRLPSGDTLVVTKLDRLARSLPDARDIVEELTEAGVKLNIGGSVHDPTDPVGRLLFNVLGDDRRIRVGPHQDADEGGHEGRQGQGPAARQAAQALPAPGSPPRRPGAGKHTSAELAELFSVARSTVYRAIERARTAAPAEP